MGISRICTSLILAFTIASTLAIDIDINCIYKPDQIVWTAIGTPFTICELQTDLKPSDTIVNAIGNTGSITNTAVQVFVSNEKKVLQIPNGLINVFKNLMGIKFDSTGFKFLDSEMLKVLTGLKYLAITNGNLEVIFGETFKGFANLVLIDLSGNPIMFIGPSAFDGTSALNNLNLNNIMCLPGDSNSEADRLRVVLLLGTLAGNCDISSNLETTMFKSTKDLLAVTESSEKCETGNEEECPEDCSEELEDIILQLNSTIDDLTKCSDEKKDLNADVLDLKKKVEELEALTSNTGDGTCSFKTVSNVYSCYAKISVKTAAEQTVKWNGTHATGKTNTQVLAMVIYSQTVEILPLNIGTVFKSLKTLTVRNSRLTKIKADDFKTLTKLETLEITGNNISSIDAAAFSGLTVLTKIDLSANKITALPSKVFDTLPKLSILNLSDNSLKIRYDVINSTNVVSEIYLRNNKAIVPLDTVFIYRFSKARKIDLSGTGCEFSLDKTKEVPDTFMSFYNNILNNC